jgi:hypothetical protein
VERYEGLQPVYLRAVHAIVKKVSILLLLVGCSILGCKDSSPAAAPVTTSAPSSTVSTKPGGGGRASFSISSMKPGPGKVDFGSKSK